MRRQELVDFWKTERSRLISYVKGLIDDTADRDGEDVVQDVLEGILRQPDLSHHIEDLSAYVYRALRNRVIDAYRKRRDTVSIDAPIGDDEGLTLASILSGATPDAFDEVSEKEIRWRVLAAIESLRDEEQAVVIETELNDRSFKELSEEWEVPIGTLLSRKSRALAKIADALADLEEEWEEDYE